jgi:predicted transposase
MKAILVNETENDKNVIDNMMLVFCSAIRYSFKRQLEGIKISELEKIVSDKYNLNIRQAKDAVESARQTILSQKELIKMNYEDYSKKVKAIEKILNDKDKKLSEKKRNALLCKLEDIEAIINSTEIEQKERGENSENNNESNSSE